MSIQTDEKECLICFHTLPEQQFSICSKNHLVCKNCLKILSRQDCIICNPCSITITIEQDTLDTSNTLDTNREPTLGIQREPSEIKECILCLRQVIKYLTIFWLSVYLGKVYFTFFYYCNSQLDGSWVSWTSFRYLLADALCGVIVSAILFSCCCLPS